MRRITLGALAVAAISAVAAPAALTAQTPTPPRHERGAMMRSGAAVDRIIEKRAELGLTDAQVTQLREIGTRLEEQNRPLIAQLQAARPERPQLTPEQRAQMRERRAAMMDSVRQLTPEQRRQMRERRSAMMDSVRRMTPEQRTQMRERMQQRRAEGDSARRPRMRTEPLPEELRPVVEQLRANTVAAMQQIRSTLTAEQQEKLREMRPAMRRQRESSDHRPARPWRLRVKGSAPRAAN